jgi:uncharacterized protein
MSDTSSGELPLDQQKQFSMLTHLSGLLFPLLGALVGYLLWKDKGDFVSKNTLAALNFSISAAIYLVGASIIAAIGFFLIIPLFLPWAVWIFYAVMCIIAGIKANNGEEYSYPLSISFIK